MKGEFSVCQFFTEKGISAFNEKSSYEYVKRSVSAEEAAKEFTKCCTCVAADIGFVQRVIITDGGGCVNAEWIYGKGLVYPSKGGERK